MVNIDQSSARKIQTEPLPYVCQVGFLWDWEGVEGGQRIVSVDFWDTLMRRCHRKALIRILRVCGISIPGRDARFRVLRETVRFLPWAELLLPTPSVRRER